MASLSRPNRLRAAAVQMTSSLDKRANLEIAVHLIEQAAAAGAELVVLPEFFNGLGRLADVVAQAEPIPGPSSDRIASLAAELGVWIVAGSICERTDDPQRGRNTSLVFNARGDCVATYRKIHLFDVTLSDSVRFAESEHIACGDQPVTFDSPWGRFGLATCYDLRFPELFRALVDQGMRLLAFPSAFLAETGAAHWHVLLRARAIENQVFVMAANQVGRHGERLQTFGRPLLIDPWGVVLADTRPDDQGASFVIADLELTQIDAVRERLPALDHRRL